MNVSDCEAMSKKMDIKVKINNYHDSDIWDNGFELQFFDCGFELEATIYKNPKAREMYGISMKVKADVSGITESDSIESIDIVQTLLKHSTKAAYLFQSVYLKSLEQKTKRKLNKLKNLGGYKMKLSDLIAYLKSV